MVTILFMDYLVYDDMVFRDKPLCDATLSKADVVYGEEQLSYC